MVEYETIGIVAVITGLFSYQIKFTFDRIRSKLEEEIERAKDVHEGFSQRLERLENK